MGRKGKSREVSVQGVVMDAPCPDFDRLVESFCCRRTQGPGRPVVRRAGFLRTKDDGSSGCFVACQSQTLGGSRIARKGMISSHIGRDKSHGPSSRLLRSGGWPRLNKQDAAKQRSQDDTNLDTVVVLMQIYQPTAAWSQGIRGFSERMREEDPDTDWRAGKSRVT